ncbi:MAG: CARDB domain-containing protein, partial [Planctomycetota bacterium]
NSSDPGELQSPAEVTIPAGQNWVEFAVAGVQDNQVDGNTTAVLRAEVLLPGGEVDPEFLSGDLVWGVLDTSDATLAWSLSANSVTEGEAITATLTRPESAAGESLFVSLATSGPGQLAFPASVTFAAGQSQLSFEIEAVADVAVEIDRSFALRAGAYGNQYDTTIEVIDATEFGLQLALRDEVIAENVNGPATLATVTRTGPTERPLDVLILSSDSSRLQVPTEVRIPAGRDSVEFVLIPLDNFTSGDSQTVTISAFALDALDEVSQVQPGTSAEVLVHDNDSPTLTVELDRGLAVEGAITPAAVGQVTRNTDDLSQPLVVTLTSDDPGEATVPSTVTIPAGQRSADFDVDTVEDNVSDGNQVVRIRATASSFNFGQAILIVSDIDKPDLRIASLEIAGTTRTGETASVTYTVANEGRTTALATWFDRLYLSTDTVLSSDDVALGDVSSDVDLAAGESTQVQVDVTLPETVGTYYVIVSSDILFQVDEILEDNNRGYSAAVNITPAYTATAQVAIEQTVQGTPVVITGSATLAASGTGAANLPVAVRVQHNDGFIRTLTAVTDGDGNYSTTFVPLADEAGVYTVDATHPGEP